MEQKLKNVQVQMLPDTLEQLDKIKERLRATSGGEALRRSVEITEMLLRLAGKNGSIEVENAQGKRVALHIPGVS
ncbi:hypothetical protein [Piscirickettsia litoralis]|uniref:Uncharacterized protein n=1 Tax=Piscirickettsia litoralis TaxID=1891921 RepID=A0ABX2ZYF0_9GAMM|nr:hypothetical protein [Piscirickettsia litoralis]ODN41032.1 hypothetical protein BGC07_18550 [Piscirickettsia litoralis]